MQPNNSNVNFYVMLCYGLLCYVMLCYVQYVMLCYVMLWSFIDIPCNKNRILYEKSLYGVLHNVNR